MDRFFTRLVLSEDTQNRVTRHALFWLACWAFQGFIYKFLYNQYPDGQAFFISYFVSLAYLPQHMLLSYSIIYGVLPKLIFKGKYWIGVASIFVLILISAAISPLTLKGIILPFRDWLGYPSHGTSVFLSFMGGLRGSMTIAGFAVAIKLVKYWYLKQIAYERLQRENLRAELELLKGQLHPHFMFNTLNSIYSLSLRNASQTPDAILQLANLMRYMIAESSGPSVSLEKEIQILSTYMNLEKSRLGERLDQSLTIRGEFQDKEVAPLLFLPFLENSYKHGAFESTGQAWITLDINVNDTELAFKLVNGKNGNKDFSRQGIGLQNVKKRLSLLYPDSHDLRISDNEDSFVVSLTLMLNRLKVPA